ncbi:uncharacterized protein LOC115879917 [Sitophilus oryzae]|uniref:Uncharacterized protein LOC115879917 n=1 Tax=Sitophilus oryzae TaxID=7048 RepID=A0A6J2XMS9_SITOR|nr:uncharacterized protein LOC115879917 [Sitophilus oryzae]
MEKIATENLFLLEFLVDSVTLDPKCDCEAPPGETCVSFQFLDNAPLDVCEADFNPKRSIKNDRGSVKSGKSCLFSLSPEQATAATEQFDIAVSVMRKMQPGWLPETVEIGASVISVSNLFNELISSVELSDGSSPTAKTLKDVFNISDPSNASTVIGKISVYIRMSCFGKLIVTQFQMNLDDKSVLFKDKEGKSLYRYKKAGKKGGQQGGDLQRGYNSTCPTSPCLRPSGAGPQEAFNPRYGSMPNDLSGFPNTNTNGLGQYAAGCPAGCPIQQPGGFQNGLPANNMMTPCNECGYIPNAACLPPGAGMMPNAFDMGPVMPQVPDGNYQEIGASLGGNSLTIRVHKDKGKLEQVDPNAPDCTCGDGGALAISGKSQNQQAFAMRPGVPGNSPFSFRMGQHGDSGGYGQGGNVVVNPPVCTSPDGTQFTEFSDPNKEMFILRIGKKSEGVDKKNNLELELQTPKGPPLKPIPKKETVETQYDPKDVGADDTASKKSKGCKGKGGGKGKGKKKK